VPEELSGLHYKRFSTMTETTDTSQTTTPRIAFVSGPIDADNNYFTTHYASHIDSAIAAGHSFVMGPVAGIDTLTLHYLVAKTIDKSRITVYMAHFEYLVATWRSQYLDLGVNVRDVVDAGTTRERDAAMTRDSDYDILRYRTEEEAKALYGSQWWPRVSNTEMNERRRRGVTSGGYNLGGSVASVQGVEATKEKDDGGLRGRFGKFLGKSSR
jgi:hypothetical protein